ncbi:hypothetical protein B23_1763 [Geobacillus thermoleovorans B23]|nr:hypothetical protein B23_1763 [Geobacillus thermoleovorans B23]
MEVEVFPVRDDKNPFLYMRKGQTMSKTDRKNNA